MRKGSEGKNREWYENEIRRTEQEIDATRHQIQRWRQRARYMRSEKDRARNHRLIQYGVAFESRYRELSQLTLTELFHFIESILALPEVKRLIDTACFEHILGGGDDGSVSL